MPRIRSFKPEIFMSPQVMNLCRDARLLFFGLISQADDDGRGTADPRKLKAAVFPGDDDITSARVGELLIEVEAQQLCLTYDGNGHGRLYHLPTFRSHQYIQKPKRSAYPPPPKSVASEHSRNGTGIVPDADGTRTVGSDLIGSDRKDRRGSEGEGRAHNSPSGSRAPKPTEAELRSKVRALRQSGSKPVEIVKLLAQYGVTKEQVTAWEASAA